MINSLQSSVLYRKKFAILICGIVLYFLTSMAKVLIPGIIFNDLLNKGLDARMISGTGAAFMYSYAVSQLLAGLFSNRYGGVRILLAGGTFFALGTIAFPWQNSYCLMLLCRILTGLGAGTVFLGVVKLLSDLFSGKFAIALGTVMLLSYFGPSCGTTPMVLLTKHAGWQMAMSLPGIIAGAAVAIIILLMRGTVKDAVPGNAIKELTAMLKNREMWLLNISCPIIFGAYYVLCSQIGQKSITDHCALTPAAASMVILTLTILVAVNNVAGNLLLKLCGNRRKAVIITAFIFSIAGAATGYCAFASGNSLFLMITSFTLIAIPAGFFPVYGLVAKELNPPEQTGLAVAVLNFWCFVYIAFFQNISGRILQYYSDAGYEKFPPEAYCRIFIFLAAAGCAGLITSIFIRETFRINK